MIFYLIGVIQFFVYMMWKFKDSRTHIVFITMAAVSSIAWGLLCPAYICLMLVDRALFGN